MVLPQIIKYPQNPLVDHKFPDQYCHKWGVNRSNPDTPNFESYQVDSLYCINYCKYNYMYIYIYIYIQYTYSPYHIISPLSPILSPYILAASAFAPSMKCHRHVIPRDGGIPRYHWRDVAVTWRLSPG